LTQWLYHDIVIAMESQFLNDPDKTVNTYTVDEIRGNPYMGAEYYQVGPKFKTIFLFGKMLDEIAPDLVVRIGDRIRITTGEHNRTLKIEKV